MLSPSDFNNAVPQFTNGDYASNPINPQYIAEPDAVDYNRGTEPLQTLPAQWWNWFLNRFTNRFNKVNVYVKNIFNELAQVLSIFNITPDGTEQTPTSSQLKTVFECCYPQYVKTAANLVDTATTVNGHPLSSNVTVTRSDLGLGTSAIVNTGTAAGCIPTVGTALGATNNNILVTDSTGKLKPSGITVGTAAGCDASLFARKTEIDALYGNVVGTPLGTAAVGSATTFARSDHVHPMPTMNQVGNAGIENVAADSITRKIILNNSIVNTGYVTRAAIGLKRGTGGWGTLLLSVGCNDAGTDFYDYCFSTDGYISGVCFTGRACSAGNADYATSAGSATSAGTSEWATNSHCARGILIEGCTYCGQFFWSAQSGQPNWIWGSNDGCNIYAWNPSCFCVCRSDGSTRGVSAYAKISTCSYIGGGVGIYYYCASTRNIPWVTRQYAILNGIKVGSSNQFDLSNIIGSLSTADGKTLGLINFDEQWHEIARCPDATSGVFTEHFYAQMVAIIS